MIKSAKILIATSAFAVMGASASDFDAKFNYYTAAPAEVTYEHFQKMAAKQCKIDRKGVSYMARKKQAKICAEDLVKKAVEATGLDSLISYHEQRSKTSAERLVATRG